MQAQSMKLLRTKSNRLLFFFYSNGSIVLKQGAGAAFSSPEVIIENVSPNFSVCLSSEDIPYLLCSSLTGSIYFCKGNGGYWDKKLLMENAQFHENSMKFYIFTERDNIHLIYSTPGEDGKESYLMILTCHNGKWESPYKIDAFVPFRKHNFLIHTIEKNHIILYYKSKDNKINSREMLLSPVTLGTLTPLIHYTYPCIDFSFLTATNKIHILALIKGTFSTQLVYKNKVKSEFSKAVVLFEGQKMEDCLIFKMRNRIWITWRMGGQFFYVTSDDDGAQFTNPQKFQRSFGKNLIKIEYQTLSGADLFCNEVLISEDAPNEVVMIPEIDPNFYGAEKRAKTGIREAYPEEMETPAILKNRLMHAEDALKKANEELMQMTKDLTQRNSDISSINTQWHQQVNQLRKELAVMEKKWIESQEECERLKKTKANIATEQTEDKTLIAAGEEAE